ncbi:C-type lectin domain family 2 member B-like [Hypanus sabinus]|uniref:C-type lectin domain family 2 member B-like n=1 Tax=Hypanus sabinus TaxID=79690 RepID=UPI0028C452C4|nr:C-type lectin domain family 2 member B-like [Hypanus sabinus]
MESRSPSRAAHEQEPRHRPCRKICLLCLVTSVLVAIVAGLSIHEKACSQDWIGNAGLCYFISTFESSYELAKQLCSIPESKLLEISSNEEEDFVDSAVRGEDSSYWIGTCKTGKVASNVVYKVNSGKFECGECKSGWIGSCKNDQHRFICEKPAALCPDIPEKIRDLCQNPVERT